MEASSSFVFTLVVVPLVLGAILGLFRRSFKFISLLSAASSLVILYSGVVGISTWRISLMSGSRAPLLGSFSSISFGVDGLSAFFLIILGIIGFCVSVYGFSFIRKKGVGMYYFSYPLFLLSMFLVLVVRNLLWFILLWEVMTLFSQFLVAFEGGDAKKAVFRYFCTVKGAADFMVLSIVVIVVQLAGGANYSVISSRLPVYLSSHTLAFYLVSTGMLIGLGVKAALVPFHFWVPEAYTMAPGNVSALLSGVMEKLPVYMMFRYFVGFVPLSAYVGMFIAVAGTLTLFFGTMFALKQTNSKRLLSYHSVGQVGYIVMALGAGIYLLSRGYVILGALALMASLFHSLNHATFKSLLFLTAGSVFYKTRTRDLDRLGGLGRVMPLTAVSALIGSLAIAGVPPLNGFVSKWMIYASTMPVPTLLCLFGAFALFISSVTAASFVKYFTSTFVRPPVKELRVDGEVPTLMVLPQLILAALCIFFGAYPYLPMRAISRALSAVGVATPQFYSFPGLVIPKGIGNVAPLVFLVIMLGVSTTAIALSGVWRKLPVWTTGTRKLPELSMRLPASSYYASFEREFEEVYEFGASVRGFGVSTLRKIRGLSGVLDDVFHNVDGTLIGAFVALLVFIVILGGVAL